MLWAEKHLSIGPYASKEDIQWHLMQKKDKLRCSKCGAYCAEIKRKKTNKRQTKKSANYEKRYIEPGISGTREDNKKMRGRQWARSKKPFI
jgi:hypothetical protein